MNSKTVDIVKLFFSELKKYNLTIFRTLEKADLSESNPIIHKAFSSVVTRYFIFCEMHPELLDVDKRVLYFKLKIDMLSKYFAEYPDGELDALKAFQSELRNYVQSSKGGTSA